MPLTGLFLLPVQPSQPSPTPNLISHITRSFPVAPLPNYSLHHHLFFDTSSLLPGSDTNQRRYTQVLNSSHDASRSYVGSSSPAGSSTSLTQITIPSTSTDGFLQLLQAKLQPQWAHRQTLIIENGTSLSLRDGEWTLRIGDLRIPPRPNQAGGTLRGVFFEITHHSTDTSVSGEELKKDDEPMLTAFLATLLEGTGLKVEGAKIMLRNVDKPGLEPLQQAGATRISDGEKTKDSPPNWSLANLYMDMLRGARG